MFSNSLVKICLIYCAIALVKSHALPDQIEESLTNSEDVKSNIKKRSVAYLEHQLHPNYCLAQEPFLKSRLLSSEELEEAAPEYPVYQVPAESVQDHWEIVPRYIEETNDYKYLPYNKHPTQHYNQPEILFVQELPRGLEVLVKRPLHTISVEDAPHIRNPLTIEKSELTEETKDLKASELNENPKQINSPYRQISFFTPKLMCSQDDAPVIGNVEAMEQSGFTAESSDLLKEELSEREFIPSDKASEFKVVEMNPEIVAADDLVKVDIEEPHFDSIHQDNIEDKIEEEVCFNATTPRIGLTVTTERVKEYSTEKPRGNSTEKLKENIMKVKKSNDGKVVKIKKSKKKLNVSTEVPTTEKVSEDVKVESRNKEDGLKNERRASGKSSKLLSSSLL